MYGATFLLEGEETQRGLEPLEHASRMLPSSVEIKLLGFIPLRFRQAGLFTKNRAYELKNAPIASGNPGARRRPAHPSPATSGERSRG